MEAPYAIEAVQFELSNVCPYAHAHARCPASVAGPPVVLPTALVEKALTWLGSWGFTGQILFSVYNEPLSDPRLFYLLAKVKETCECASVLLHSNGFNLDRQLLGELERAGVTKLKVNGYNPAELERLTALRGGGCHMRVRDGSLDGRMNLYERAPTQRGKAMCVAPYRAVTIWHTGEVGLCCLDWKRTVTFGSLADQSLKDILESPAMLEAARQDKHLDVCCRCERGPR